MNTWQLEYSFFLVFHCYSRSWHWCQLVAEMLVDWNNLQGKGLIQHRDREGYVRQINIQIWPQAFRANFYIWCCFLCIQVSFVNRPFSKMAVEISNKSKLKPYTSARKNTFTLVSLQSFSISGVISAERMQVEN